MGIDLVNERRLTPPQAARFYGSFRPGTRTSPATVIRHILDGVIGPNGERVRLEAAKFGGRWITSEEAIRRFVSRLTPGSRGSQPARQSSRAHETADAACAAIGL